MRGVPNSKEFRRIRDLPRRAWDLSNVPDLTPIFAKQESGKMGKSQMILRPLQSAALLEIEACKGGFLPVGVGYGKTLIALLAPRILNAKRPILLVEAALKETIEKVEIPRYSEHFDLPKWHAIVSYNGLSSPKLFDLLDQLCPDAIICDEAHNLRHRSSVRVRRLARYLKENPSVMAVFMSGTMTAKSLKDYSHLAKWALHEGSPVPYDFYALEEWGAALDSNPIIPLGPGVLATQLCQDHMHDSHKDAYRCRLVSTPGVISTSETALGTSLNIEGRHPEIPIRVETALEELRTTWTFDGQDIADTLEFHRYAHQLALGFHYHWVWDEGPDLEWLEARSEWARFVRSFLVHRSNLGLDSEGLLFQAIENQQVKISTAESKICNAWKNVRNRPGPRTEATWLDYFILNDIGKWIDENDNGIIWYKDSVMGKEIADRGELKHFGPGGGISLAKTNREEHPFIVVSMKAHASGHNLQSWDNNLVVGMPGNAKLEQLLARTHRFGQEADRVKATLYQHSQEFRESFQKALNDAQYVETTTGQIQKLNFANKIGFGI